MMNIPWKIPIKVLELFNAHVYGRNLLPAELPHQASENEKFSFSQQKKYKEGLQRSHDNHCFILQPHRSHAGEICSAIVLHNKRRREDNSLSTVSSILHGIRSEILLHREKQRFLSFERSYPGISFACNWQTIMWFINANWWLCFGSATLPKQGSNSAADPKRVPNGIFLWNELITWNLMSFLLSWWLGTRFLQDFQYMLPR